MKKNWIKIITFKTSCFDCVYFYFRFKKLTQFNCSKPVWVRRVVELFDILLGIWMVFIKKYINVNILWIFDFQTEKKHQQQCAWDFEMEKRRSTSRTRQMYVHTQTKMDVVECSKNSMETYTWRSAAHR